MCIVVVRLLFGVIWVVGKCCCNLFVSVVVCVLLMLKIVSLVVFICSVVCVMVVFVLFVLSWMMWLSFVFGSLWWNDFVKFD